MTRALYLDCYSGISGNMFFAAMLNLGLDEAAWRVTLARLPVEGVDVVLERVDKRGVRALHGDVRYPEQHAHRHLGDVLAILKQAELDDAVLLRAERIFTRLAQAEAEVHGTTVDEVHFHEVGAVDAIVDVVSAAWLLEAAHVERVLCSPVRTGFGLVKCAHGLMPVPAPATALLLRGVPSYAGDVEGELATPTGAAILAASVDEFVRQPPMRVERVGWGAGTRDAPFPNCLRVLLGDLERRTPVKRASVTAGSAPRPAVSSGVRVDEMLLEVEAHVDDMTGQDLGFLLEELLATAAVDVIVMPAVGKKGRPAQVVRALARPEDEDRLLDVLFSRSSTLGARVRLERRVRLLRDDVTVRTSAGVVRAKRTSDGRLRPEHDDLARLARESGRPLADLRAEAQRGEPEGPA